MRRTALGRMVLVGFLIPCVAAIRASGPHHPAQRLADGIDTTFAFDPHGTVTIENENEAIVVSGWDQGRVHLKSRGAVTLRGGRSAVSVSSRRGPDGDERIEVSVPRGTRVVARTQSGDVTIRGTRGRVEAHTNDGDVDLVEIDTTEVHTLSGDVTASAVGACRVVTVSGSASVTDTHADVDLESVTGDLVVKQAVSRHVRAKTTNGDVTFVGAILQDGTYELTSHAGDVGITLQRDAGAQVDASTWSGSVDSAFPLTLRPGQVVMQPGGQGKHVGATKHYSFQIGKGGGHITVDTFSGDITISSREKP